MHYLLRPLSIPGLCARNAARHRLSELEGPANVRTGHSVPQKDAVANHPSKASAAAGLAALFPEATAVRIPVRVTALRGNARALAERTVIEFGTAREVLFDSVLPLEFEDHVQIENSDSSLQAEATVVAVQYDGRRKAVAARFLREVSNWIIKP